MIRVLSNFSNLSIERYKKHGSRIIMRSPIKSQLAKFGSDILSDDKGYYITMESSDLGVLEILLK